MPLRPFACLSVAMATPYLSLFLLLVILSSSCLLYLNLLSDSLSPSRPLPSPSCGLGQSWAVRLSFNSHPEDGLLVDLDVVADEVKNQMVLPQGSHAPPSDVYVPVDDAVRCRGPGSDMVSKMMEAPCTTQKNLLMARVACIISLHFVPKTTARPITCTRCVLSCFHIMHYVRDGHTSWLHFITLLNLLQMHTMIERVSLPS